MVKSRFNSLVDKAIEDQYSQKSSCYKVRFTSDNTCNNSFKNRKQICKSGLDGSITFTITIEWRRHRTVAKWPTEDKV